jgi:hypothetical protein
MNIDVVRDASPTRSDTPIVGVGAGGRKGVPAWKALANLDAEAEHGVILVWAIDKNSLLAERGVCLYGIGQCLNLTNCFY